MGKLLGTFIIVLLIFIIYKIVLSGRFKARYKTNDLDILFPAKKVNRNDDCPCKSGVKYKNCCGDKSK